MESTSKIPLQALANPSFIPAYYSNPDNILISFGPQNGMLWRAEEIGPQEINLVEGLNKVFQTGFTQRDEQSVLAQLPYMKSHYPNFICASNTHLSDKRWTAWESQQAAAGNYGYFYLIDSSSKNAIESIPLCEENRHNSNFVAAYAAEIKTEPDYAIITKLDPKFIIGAVPSEFVAFSLEMEQKRFITNPIYQGITYFNKIEEVSGISSFLTFDVFAMKYQHLARVDIFKFYSAKKELITSPNLLSLPSGSATHFFPTNPRSKLPEASASNVEVTAAYKNPY
jgi:hypothetical protein